MSTATMSDPSLAYDDEAPGGFMDPTPEELALVRRLRQRANQTQHSPYRKALLARSRCRKQEQADKIPLPGGGYQSYRLMHGRHERYDLRDVEIARKESARLKEAHGPNFAPLDPEKHIFRPGDVVTPETDLEALMIDQDPMKFRPLGPAEAAQTPDLLEAELNRQKQLAGEKDAEIAALKEQLAAAQKPRK